MKKVYIILWIIVLIAGLFIFTSMISSRPSRVASREIESINKQIKQLDLQLSEKTKEREKYENIQQGITNEAYSIRSKKNELNTKKSWLQIFLWEKKTSIIWKVSAWNILNLKYIVVHHTANYTTLEKEMSWDYKKFWRYPYNYYIDDKWIITKVNEDWINVWSTLNVDVNNTAIQIALIWNFNVWYPSAEQYASLKILIDKLKTKYWALEVVWHNEVWQTACPGKNFNIKIFK